MPEKQPPQDNRPDPDHLTLDNRTFPVPDGIFGPYGSDADDDEPVGIPDPDHLTLDNRTFPVPDGIFGPGSGDAPAVPEIGGDPSGGIAPDFREPPPEVPEIGMISTGFIAPDFSDIGPWPPVGEDTPPPPPGEPGETPPQQPDQLIEFRDVPPGEIPKFAPDTASDDPGGLSSSPKALTLTCSTR